MQDDLTDPEQHRQPDHRCTSLHRGAVHDATCQVAWRTRRIDPTSTSRWLISTPYCDEAADEYERGLPGPVHAGMFVEVLDVQRLPL